MKRSRSEPRVSVLYREPKLLKASRSLNSASSDLTVSVLYREPKLLKVPARTASGVKVEVSVLYREPKLLKAERLLIALVSKARFSALP